VGGAGVSREDFHGQSAAQRAHDDAYPYDDANEALAERIDQLAAEYAADDAKLREAEEWVAGTFDGSHYSEITLALFDLHETDADRLIGSDLLTRLYRLAATEHAAMTKKLAEMAEEDVADEDRAWASQEKAA